VIDMLRQRARPYLFSNALPPMVVAAGLEVLKIVEDGDEAARAPLRERMVLARKG
jgi:glycine C-acetyltransferase